MPNARPDLFQPVQSFEMPTTQRFLMILAISFVCKNAYCGQVNTIVTRIRNEAIVCIPSACFWSLLLFIVVCVCACFPHVSRHKTNSFANLSSDEEIRNFSKGTIYETRGATKKRIPIRGQVRAALSFEWHLSDGKLRFTIENRAAAAAQPFVVSLSFFKCFGGDGSNSSRTKNVRKNRSTK